MRGVATPTLASGPGQTSTTDVAQQRMADDSFAPHHRKRPIRGLKPKGLLSDTTVMAADSLKPPAETPSEAAINMSPSSAPPPTPTLMPVLTSAPHNLTPMSQSASNPPPESLRLSDAQEARLARGSTLTLKDTRALVEADVALTMAAEQELTTCALAVAPPESKSEECSAASSAEGSVVLCGAALAHSSVRTWQ